MSSALNKPSIFPGADWHERDAPGVGFDPWESWPLSLLSEERGKLPKPIVQALGSLGLQGLEFGFQGLELFGTWSWVGGSEVSGFIVFGFQLGVNSVLPDRGSFRNGGC